MQTFISWLVTFGKILINPSPRTFTSEAKKAGGKFSTAIAWLVLLITLIYLWFYLAYRILFPAETIIATILMIPIIFLFYVFCVHFFYTRLFHHKEYHYEEFLYLMVGIFVPYTLIAILVLRIPHIGTILADITMVIALILTVIAVKTITQLKYWQAYTVVLLSTILAVAGYCCIPTVLLRMLLNMNRMI